jgi:hypothetical protein
VTLVEIYAKAKPAIVHIASMSLKLHFINRVTVGLATALWATCFILAHADVLDASREVAAVEGGPPVACGDGVFDVWEATDTDVVGI